LKLLPDEKKAMEQRGTTSAEAYNLFLMARQFWITGNHGDVRRDERVIRICQRAVEIDPGYARAWGLMALAQANLRFGLSKGGDGGLAAAERALSIDPSIAEAYCVTARHLSDDGMSAEADAAIETALRLDPESWEVNKEAARQCMLTRRIPEAARHFEKSISLMESDFHSWGMLITCYRAQGDMERTYHAAKMMVEEAERILAQDPSNAAALGLIATGLAVLGERERAREWIERALLLDPDNLNIRYNFACALANELQEMDFALDLIEDALARTGGFIVRVVESDPDMDVLRDDPRFQKALADAKARLGAEAGAATPAAAASEAPPRS
jgi:adenylate cyclase